MLPHKKSKCKDLRFIIAWKRKTFPFFIKIKKSAKLIKPTIAAAWVYSSVATAGEIPQWYDTRTVLAKKTLIKGS